MISLTSETLTTPVRTSIINIVAAVVAFDIPLAAKFNRTAAAAHS